MHKGLHTACQCVLYGLFNDTVSISATARYTAG